jgi:hypothetical protein
MDFAQGTNIPYEFRNANIIYGKISYPEIPAGLLRLQQDLTQVAYVVPNSLTSNGRGAIFFMAE